MFCLLSTTAGFLLLVCMAEAVKSESNPLEMNLPFTPHEACGKIDKAIPYPLQELTVCNWVRFYNSYDWQTMFQYSVPGQIREISTMVHSKFILFSVGGVGLQQDISSKPVNGEWRYYCFTWSAYTGSMNIYENGKRTQTATDKAVGHAIVPNGTAILGNDPLENNAYPWLGAISEVQLWGNVLCPTEIAALAKCRSKLEGDVISWSNVNVKTVDGAALKPTNVCEKLCVLNLPKGNIG